MWALRPLAGAVRNGMFLRDSRSGDGVCVVLLGVTTLQSRFYRMCRLPMSSFADFVTCLSNHMSCFGVGDPHVLFLGRFVTEWLWGLYNFTSSFSVSPLESNRAYDFQFIRMSEQFVIQQNREDRGMSLIESRTVGFALASEDRQNLPSASFLARVSFGYRAKEAVGRG